jgi:sodium/bile acid cotransporter 7
MLSLLHSLSLYAFFLLFNALPFSREEVTAGAICASHKTLAFGLPLVNTIFEGNPNLAAYCAPIMFIHPLQLVLGSLFTSKFESYISKGKGA